VRWLALAVIAAACSSNDTGDTLAKVRASGVLSYGADFAGGEPYIYEDPKDPSKVIGFEVDIINAIARRLGVRAELRHYEWSNLVPALERGDFDVVMNGLEATAERRDRILLSAPYFTYAETLAVRRDSPYRYLADLTDRPVGTLNQTVAYDILRRQPVELRIYEDNVEPYLDLEQHRLDGVLLDNIIASRYGCTAEHRAVMCLPGDVARGAYVIGIRKSDPDLKAAIDNAIAAMRADGELERILRGDQLWDERQTEVAPAVVDDTAARATSFDTNQLQLFLAGAAYTLLISLAAFALAMPIGAGLAIAGRYGGPVPRALARGYIELFRGTPVLLQLYVIYFGLGPYYSMGPITAAVLGLGLNYGAYEAEVYRGALAAIPRGQTEAAKALGLGGWQTLRYVLLPQALRSALPAMTNDFVSMLKDSSLVSVISVIELTKRMQIAAIDLRGWLVPGLACAGLYLAMSLPLAELARRLERRLARDNRPLTL
jgi:polar amino acid transport system substrate-binding protein